MEPKKKHAILRQGLKQSRRTITRYFINPRAYVLLATDLSTMTPAGFAVWLAPMTSNAERYKRHLSLKYRSLSWAFAAYDTFINFLLKAKLHWLLPSLGVAVLHRQRMWAKHTDALESQYISLRSRQQGYWQLSLLGVHPAFAGRGIAKRLLKWGTDKADHDNRVCYLSASPKGLPVYEKAGFQVVGADICYPKDPQGGWTETFMVRDRQSEKLQQNSNEK